MSAFDQKRTSLSAIEKRAPHVKAVMEADGIDPRELEAELQQIAARLRATWNTPKPGLASASGDAVMKNAVNWILI